jgi:hypothetical protein
VQKRDDSGVLEPMSANLAQMSLQATGGSTSSSKPATSTEQPAESTSTAPATTSNFPPPKLDLFDILTSDVHPSKDNTITPSSDTSSQAALPAYVLDATALQRTHSSLKSLLCCCAL